MIPWVFCISKHSPYPIYSKMAIAAVNSARQNTSLRPVMIYDGDQMDDLAVKMGNIGVSVVCHDSKKWSNFSDFGMGMLMKLDAPMMLDSELILLTDCDVLFLREIDDLPRTNLIACCLEFGVPWCLNAGVCVVNKLGYSRIYSQLMGWISEHPSSVANENWDQGVLQRVLKRDQWDTLPVEWNWKAYHPLVSSAKILHFHGPKPDLDHRDMQNFKQLMTPDFYRSVEIYKGYS